MARDALKSKPKRHKGDTSAKPRRKGKTPNTGGTAGPIKRSPGTDGAAAAAAPGVNPAAPHPNPPPKPNTGVEFKPTPDQRMLVQLGKAAGYTDEQLAAIINYPFGISVEALTKHFDVELKTGKDYVNLAVVGNLFKLATGNGKSAGSCAIFWAKSQLKWRTADGITLKSNPNEGGGEGGKGSLPLSFTLTIGDRDDGDDNVPD